MSPAEKIVRQVKVLMRISSHHVGTISDRLRQTAQCEAYLRKPDPAIMEAVDRAAELWISSHELCFMEEGRPALTAEQKAEATAMICAKAMLVYETVYSVWMLEMDGVMSGTFHAETAEMAFLLVWKRFCPAGEGWGDDRLRDKLLDIINSVEEML